MKFLVFLGHVWLGYQRWKYWFVFAICGQGYRWWKFLFFGHFWPRLPTVKVFVFLAHFWPRLPTVKVLVILAMVTFIGHFGCEYQWWKLWLWFGVCFWANSGISLCQTRVAGGNRWHPTVQAGFCAPRGNCWYGIESTSILYTGRQALAKKYDYTHTTVGKVLKLVG